MGRVARTKSHQTRDRARQLSPLFNGLLVAIVIGVLCLSATVPALSQSGKRRPEPGKSGKREGPVADPDRPGTSSSPNRPSRATDEVDADDVVKISSNLVPIPASVVDKRGLAVLNLNLEDFELRVDGELRPLSDLTRSETSVRLAMLFDNSGSLDPAREFEKQAAIRFFRKVLRAKDEAAIYSIETDSYLAQPLTNDIVRLEQTIAMFGNPLVARRSSTRLLVRPLTCGHIPDAKS